MCVCVCVHLDTKSITKACVVEVWHLVYYVSLLQRPAKPTDPVTDIRTFSTHQEEVLGVVAGGTLLG